MQSEKIVFVYTIYLYLMFSNKEPGCELRAKIILGIFFLQMRHTCSKNLKTFSIFFIEKLHIPTISGRGTVFY